MKKFAFGVKRNIQFFEKVNHRGWQISLQPSLRQVVRDAELGTRFADARVQVTLFDGKEYWIACTTEQMEGETQMQYVTSVERLAIQ